ncbi:MAG: 16S rRNA (guanine(966)-N(2))-methyltransferase RsmD [Desulfobulbaceae bacterium]
MRISGGTAKGRKLCSPKGAKDSIRPTSDRVREALFSILGEKVRGARVLDLFAGTGSLGLEALSRGAASALFVDQSPQALELIRTNLHHCFAPGQAELCRLDLGRSAGFTSLARRLAPGSRFDLVFLDPPYEKKLAEPALTMVETNALAAPGGFVIAEERWKVVLPDRVGGLRLFLHRRYGETGIWLYTTENSSA